MALSSVIKGYFSQSPIVQQASATLMNYILAFLACFSPVWTFLFIKTPDSKMAKIDTTVEAMESVIPNPFSDQPVENGPTNTKRHGYNVTKHRQTFSI